MKEWYWGDLGGDGLVLYLDCSDEPMCDKMI